MGLCAESVTWGSSVNLMKALQKLPNGTHAEALALCTMLLDSGIIPLNHVDVCLTAALDVLFETLLLECCRIIVVFGIPALPFPWQVQHQRLFRHSTKAKVNGQTALFYAALKVRVKQMRGSQWAVVVHRVYGILLRQWSFVLTAV